MMDIEINQGEVREPEIQRRKKPESTAVILSAPEPPMQRKKRSGSAGASADTNGNIREPPMQSKIRPTTVVRSSTLGAGLAPLPAGGGDTDDYVLLGDQSKFANNIRYRVRSRSNPSIGRDGDVRARDELMDDGPRRVTTSKNRTPDRNRKQDGDRERSQDASPQRHMRYRESSPAKRRQFERERSSDVEYQQKLEHEERRKERDFVEREYRRKEGQLVQNGDVEQCERDIEGDRSPPRKGINDRDIGRDVEATRGKSDVGTHGYRSGVAAGQNSVPENPRSKSEERRSRADDRAYGESQNLERSPPQKNYIDRFEDTQKFDRQLLNDGRAVSSNEVRRVDERRGRSRERSPPPRVKVDTGKSASGFSQSTRSPAKPPAAKESVYIAGKPAVTKASVNIGGAAKPSALKQMGAEISGRGMVAGDEGKSRSKSNLRDPGYVKHDGAAKKYSEKRGVAGRPEQHDTRVAVDKEREARFHRYAEENRKCDSNIPPRQQETVNYGLKSGSGDKRAAADYTKAVEHRYYKSRERVDAEKRMHTGMERDMEGEKRWSLNEKVRKENDAMRTTEQQRAKRDRPEERNAQRPSEREEYKQGHDHWRGPRQVQREGQTKEERHEYRHEHPHQEERQDQRQQQDEAEQSHHRPVPKQYFDIHPHAERRHRRSASAHSAPVSDVILGMDVRRSDDLKRRGLDRHHESLDTRDQRRKDFGNKGLHEDEIQMKDVGETKGGKVESNSRQSVRHDDVKRDEHYAMRYRAGLIPVAVRSEQVPAKRRSEYQLQYRWLNAEKSSPVLAAETVAGRISADSEYRAQFKSWTPETLRKLDEEPIRAPLEDRKKDGTPVKSRRHKARRGKSLKEVASTDKRRAIERETEVLERSRRGEESREGERVKEARMEEGAIRRIKDQVRSLDTDDIPAAKSSSLSFSRQRYKSEYSSNYKPPWMFKNVDVPVSATRDHPDRRSQSVVVNSNTPVPAVKQTASFDECGASAVPSSSWYDEVLELRRSADEYRRRARGTHFSRDHLAQLFAKNTKLWEEVASARGDSTARSELEEVKVKEVRNGMEEEIRRNEMKEVGGRGEDRRERETERRVRQEAWTVDGRVDVSDSERESSPHAMRRVDQASYHDPTTRVIDSATVPTGSKGKDHVSRAAPITRDVDHPLVSDSQFSRNASGGRENLRSEPRLTRDEWPVYDEEDEEDSRRRITKKKLEDERQRSGLRLIDAEQSRDSRSTPVVMENRDARRKERKSDITRLHKTAPASYIAPHMTHGLPTRDTHVLVERDSLPPSSSISQPPETRYATERSPLRSTQHGRLDVNGDRGQDINSVDDARGHVGKSVEALRCADKENVMKGRIRSGDVKEGEYRKRERAWRNDKDSMDNEKLVSQRSTARSSDDRGHGLDSTSDDFLSTSARSITSSCSLASEVLMRARDRRNEFWTRP